MLVAGAALVARTRSSPPTSIHLRGALSCAQGKPSRAFATRATESRGEARHASPVRASTASAGAAIRSNLLKSLACRNSTLHRPLKGGLASRTARLSLGRGSSERRRDKSGTGGRHGAGQALSTMSGTVSNEDDEVWTPPQPPEGLSFLQRVWWRMGKEAIVAPPNFNRWSGVPGSFLVQVSIGSVYAWSVFNGPLTRSLGVVASSADDWALSDVMPIFSTCAATLGVCTALLGPWAERNGPRRVAACAALAWSGGLALTAWGVHTHTLAACYAGYGLLGGAGWAGGYVSPVSTLIRWFPDRRGLATGLALTAFGGGAMVATPVNEFLMRTHFKAPEYLGPAEDVGLVTEAGRRFAEVAGELKEVVVASASDLANLPGDLAEGVYVVGTGDSGTALTFLSLAGGYLVLMLTGAFTQRIPAEGWKPKGWEPPTDVDPETAAGGASVHHTQVLRTPQFYLMWGAVFGNAIAGVSIISCAKTLMGDVFSRAMPTVVDGAFAASYVAALSAANMTGRFGWSALSDKLGRRNTYFLFGLGVPLAISIPYITESVAAGAGAASMVPLSLFLGSTVLMVSFYGGLFSVLPAYLADLFGLKHVGAIHGRLLTAWSGAALVGPALLSTLRKSSYDTAVLELAREIDDDTFRRTFGAPKDSVQQLVDANTVTIGKLMDVAPEGTVDPTPTLYNTTLLTMSGVLAAAVVCNAAIRPVDKKHYLKE